MRIKHILTVLVVCLSGTFVWAAPKMAPAVPDLTLPSEEETVRPAKTSGKQARRPANSRPAARTTSQEPEVVVTNATIKHKGEYVEQITPDESKLPPIPKMPTEEEFNANFVDDMVPAKTADLAATSGKNARVAYNPKTDRDPTLSSDDTLLLKDLQERRRKEREAARKRELEAERRRIAELERIRQAELDRLRDPSREVRGKIKINGIIGQEVFIGSRVYKVNDTVLGARIVSVRPDAVVFSYKGQKFTKNVQLQ